MPREKDFDQATVIKKCTALFAASGYSATGIQEIVNASGINRSSLYATFKGKDELFLHCLQKAMLEDAAALEGLGKKGYATSKIMEEYLDMIVKDKPVYHLFKFAHAEFKLLNKKTQAALNAHSQWKNKFFEQHISSAQKSGKLSAKISAKETAGLLEVLVQGIQNVSPLANADKLYKKPAMQLVKLLQKKKA